MVGIPAYLFGIGLPADMPDKKAFLLTMVLELGDFFFVFNSYLIY